MITKKIVFLFSLIALIAIPSKSEETPIMLEEAFVTFGTSNYFGLIEVLIDSIHKFSSRPIIVWGVNADIPFSTDKYPRLIKKRIDRNLKQVSVYALKPLIITQSPVKYGIFLDADCVANYSIDALFADCYRIDQHCFSPRHPNPPTNCGPLMKAMNVTLQTMPFIHSNEVLFSYKCLPFIKEWYDASIQYPGLIRAANHDETSLNVLLWKHGATDLVDRNDPFYGYVYDYLKKPIHQNELAHIFHGCKDPKEARAIFQLLIQYNENNS